MSESCNNQCSSCSEDCADRQSQSEDFRAKPHELSSIKHVIGIVSGKGGVGKSLVTALLAVSMQRAGHSAAILDADITGPSIPRAFGIKEKAMANELGILPIRSKMGIHMMSTNFLLQNDTDPVIWRGPVIAGTAKQFWTDVIWKDIDFMFVDMPPGTGDIPLTVFQSIPLDGIVVVTSPQELVGMIVEKAVNMAKLMNIPVLALVENMSYFTCPDCDKKHHIFGESHIEEIAKKHGIDMTCQLPISPELASLTDRGMIELFEESHLDPLVDKLIQLDQ